eukprot:441110_1
MMRSRKLTRNFTKVSWKCPSRLFIHPGVRHFSSDGPPGPTARSHSTPPQLPPKNNFDVESDENDIMEKRLESLGNWIQENGALFGHEIGILGNGLFASKEVLAGETFIVVPKSLCFTRENVLKPGNCVRLCDRQVPEHEASVASVRHQSRETPHRSSQERISVVGPPRRKDAGPPGINFNAPRGHSFDSARAARGLWTVWSLGGGSGRVYHNSDRDGDI